MKKIRDWFKPRVRTTFEVDRSMGYTGPSKPRVKTAKETMKCQYIRFHNGETGALVGPWIRNGKWDGSYTVIHADERIGYYYPSLFAWTGFTIEEAIAAAELGKQQKKKKLSQKEKEGAAS